MFFVGSRDVFTVYLLVITFYGDCTLPVFYTITTVTCSLAALLFCC